MESPRSQIVYLRMTVEDQARLRQIARRQERTMAQVLYRIVRDGLREEFGEQRVAV